MGRPPLVALAVLALLPGCSIAFLESTNLVELGRINQRTSIATDVHSVHVRNNIGAITIYCDQSSNDVMVDGVVRIKHGRRNEFTSADVVRDLLVLENAGVLTIRNAHLGEDDHDDWGLDLEIHLPGGLDVTVENSVGDVTVQGEPAGVTLDVSVGQLHATLGSLTGDLLANLDTGDATLSCEQVHGRVSLTLGVGDATLHVRQGFPNDGINLEVGTGDARILVPASAAANVELEVATGDIDVRAPFALETHGHLVGQSATGWLADRGPMLRANVGVGSIELRPSR